MDHRKMEIEKTIDRREIVKTMKKPKSKKTGGIDWSNSFKVESRTLEINKLDMSMVQEGVSGGGFFNVNIEFSTGAFTDAVEDELEEEIDKAIVEVLRGCCFSCNARKVYDNENEEYYCPVCDI